MDCEHKDALRIRFDVVADDPFSAHEEEVVMYLCPHCRLVFHKYDLEHVSYGEKKNPNDK